MPMMVMMIFLWDLVGVKLLLLLLLCLIDTIILVHHSLFSCSVRMVLNGSALRALGHTLLGTSIAIRLFLLKLVVVRVKVAREGR